MNTITRAASAVMLAAACATSVAVSPAHADGAYNATVAGQRNYTPLVNLASTSTQTVDVANLPANVGLYVLHCKVPADPRTPPVACDSAAGSLVYVTATPALRPTVSIPVVVHGEFYGTNPNPTAGPSEGASVDCRAATGDPRSTACALYVLGAGKDAANPAYMRIFPTMFLPVSAQRSTDQAVVTLGGKTVAKGAKPKIANGVATPFTVTLTSGLTPTVTADNCSVTDKTITALKAEGTCVVRITSNGGKNVKPLVTTQVIRLTK